MCCVKVFSARTRTLREAGFVYASVGRETVRP